MAVNCADFHKIQSLIKFLWISLELNFVHIERNTYKMYAKIHLQPQVKYGFHYTDLHKTHNCSTALDGNLLHRISHISAKEYRKCSWKFSCALE
jgi:hypothetical protein